MIGLYVVIGLVVLCLLILAIPVEVAFEFAVPGEPKPKLRVGWLFGLVSKEPPARKAQEKKKNIRSLLALLRVKGLPDRLMTLGSQLVRCIHFKRLDADLALGLDEPADTGLLCAAAWPAIGYLNSLRSVKVTFQPCFFEPILEIRASGAVRVFPLKMAGSVLRLLFSPPVWRAAKVMAVSRWKGRKSASEIP